ncbi:hypothetical protein [Polaribacter atrinae]|uniref:Uncharacterized protein n=1 Tax=Polaribacter atrinae TaxID=1333662 RepID=A0A176T955_9FLAO|nr:hypothetical protein [Polaribacter atrinae]OAD43836.1 hypothetical protein LPB303_13080 [Polaribacter atrinae]
MTDFKSESYTNLLESHTRLNNYIKISTVSVDYLYNSKEDNKELSNLINSLILNSGERWTPRVIKEPKKQLELIKNDLTKSAIVWVYSAFDIFFKQVQGILSEHFIIKDDKSLNEDDKQHKILELYKKLNWDNKEIKTYLPILKFYESIRHCTAHNMGKPSLKLIELSKSNDFKEAITNWKTKFPKKKISAPPIIKDNIITLKPHHTIIYSETCIRIAKDLNLKMFNKLGLEYFIDKTIQKHLLSNNKLTDPKCQNLTRYLVYHLKKEINISITPYENIFKYYNEEQIEDYKKRYSSIKNNS